MSKQTVTSADQARENILRYMSELQAGSGISRNIKRHKAWYAIRSTAGVWIFGPSKFIGYRDNSSDQYLASYSRNDGRETEQVLREWFAEVDPATPLHDELFHAFSLLCSEFDKMPNKAWRVSVLKQESGAMPSKLTRNSPELERIVVDHGICGGRPRIRGTRMRVSDILELAGSGNSIEAIINEYPYLDAEDVRAAMNYAGRAVDHPVIAA